MSVWSRTYTSTANSSVEKVEVYNTNLALDIGFPELLIMRSWVMTHESSRIKMTWNIYIYRIIIDCHLSLLNWSIAEIWPEAWLEECHGGYTNVQTNGTKEIGIRTSKYQVKKKFWILTPTNRLPLHYYIGLIATSTNNRNMMLHTN